MYKAATQIHLKYVKSLLLDLWGFNNLKNLQRFKYIARLGYSSMTFHIFGELTGNGWRVAVGA